MVELDLNVMPPGILGRNRDGMAPIGILTRHGVDGLVVALVYGGVV